MLLQITFALTALLELYAIINFFNRFKVGDLLNIIDCPGAYFLIYLYKFLLIWSIANVMRTSKAVPQN